MSVTVVSGVPGVGSSRVSETARRELPDAFELLNFGDVMLEEAVSRGLAAGRDEIAALPTADYRLLQRRAGEFIAERAREAEVILDTHLVVHTAHGFLPGFPESVLREVHPDVFVLLEADPDTIVERRERSEYRSYRNESATTVSFHQQLNRAASISYSMHVGAPIRTISNEGTVEEAAAELVDIVGD